MIMLKAKRVDRGLHGKVPGEALNRELYREGGISRPSVITDASETATRRFAGVCHTPRPAVALLNHTSDRF